MIILDTNAISSLIREPADKVVMDWLDQQPRTSVWITAITMLEIHFGLQIMADGGRKLARTKAFGQLIGDVLERRIGFTDERMNNMNETALRFEAARPPAGAGRTRGATARGPVVHRTPLFPAVSDLHKFQAETTTFPGCYVISERLRSGPDLSSYRLLSRLDLDVFIITSRLCAARR
jgi:hypothetical protein